MDIVDRSIKVTCKTIKRIDTNREENLCDLWFSQRFLRQYIRS